MQLGTLNIIHMGIYIYCHIMRVQQYSRTSSSSLKGDRFFPQHYIILCTYNPLYLRTYWMGSSVGPRARTNFISDYYSLAQLPLVFDLQSRPAYDIVYVTYNTAGVHTATSTWGQATTPPPSPVKISQYSAPPGRCGFIAWMEYVGT